LCCFGSTRHAPSPLHLTHANSGGSGGAIGAASRQQRDCSSVAWSGEWRAVGTPGAWHAGAGAPPLSYRPQSPGGIFWTFREVLCVWSRGESEKKRVVKLGTPLSTGAILEKNGSPSKLAEPRDFSRLLRSRTWRQTATFEFPFNSIIEDHFETWCEEMFCQM